MLASDEITQLLVAHRNGDGEALRKLVPLVYTDLQRMARHQLDGRRSAQTLDTTGLVHEAYLKLVDQTQASYRDRKHFFRVASLAMRQVIVDYARHCQAAKRGGNRPLGSLDDVQIAVEDQAQMLVEMDQVLERLGELDPRLIQVVECRFFAGLTAEETAQALDVSTRTVERDWKRARAWLRHEMKIDGEADS